MELIYDSIIIGAGLSGLSAAYHLNGLKTCIIEKEDSMGGRVLTRVKNGIPYELGAIFKYDRDLVPFDFSSSSLIAEKDQIGLCHKGNVYLGDSVFNCIRNSCPGENEWSRILKFYIQESDAASLKDVESEMINSFFRVIHPGDFHDYIDTRQRDAFTRFHTDHYSKGNGELIEEYARRISSDILSCAEVSTVIEKNNHVEVTYQEAAKIRTIIARTAIVTAPAPVAARIVHVKNKKCVEFLGSVKYGAGVIAVMALRDAQLRDFSYVVTTGLQANTIIKSRTPMPDVTLVNAYFVAEKADSIKSLPDHDIVLLAVDCINRCSIGTITDENIMFTDICRWDMVGPVISPESYAQWDDSMRRPSERVFLAGDYVCVDPDDPMPYGMAAAILSGRKTAAEISHLLHDIH